MSDRVTGEGPDLVRLLLAEGSTAHCNAAAAVELLSVLHAVQQGWRLPQLGKLRMCTGQTGLRVWPVERS
jgi:hypothetical protein